jgi:hypothetical protein
VTWEGLAFGYRRWKEGGREGGREEEEAEEEEELQSLPWRSVMGKWGGREGGWDRRLVE